MEENIKELTKKAEQGDVKAQVELADNYYYGKNVEQDYGKAIFWSRKAAEQDNQKLEKATLNADVRVITEIGLYYRSINTFEKAQKYFEKAVAKNYGPAEFFLGEIFRDKKNNLEAVIELYEKAAEYSSDSAQKLADMYEYGDGLKQNYKKSLKWYLKAAEMDSR